MDRRSYFRHFAVLAGGTAGAQALNLLSYPLLARLYSPSDFGLFALFGAATAIPGAVACARFDLAVPTAPHHGRHAIVWVCFAATAVVGLLAAAGGAVYWSVTGGDAAFLPALLGLAVGLTGYCAAAQSYLLRNDLYRTVSVSLLVRTGSVVTAQAALALASPEPLSLILGFCLGLVVQAVHLGLAIRRQAPLGPPRARRMRLMFARYRRQVMIDIPSTFVSALSLNLMTFLLLVMFDQRTVGYYMLGNRIAIVPLQLFNDSLSRVFFQKAARAVEKVGHFWHEMKLNLLTSGGLSLAVVAAVWLLAHPFITFYLGEEWRPAADMLVILAPMLALRGLCWSVAAAVFVLRRPHWLFVQNVASVAAMAAAFAIARAAGLDVLEYLAATAALLGVTYIVFTIVLVRASLRQRAALA